MLKATNSPDQSTSYSFIFVHPSDKNWNKYVDMCFEYLNESWPKDFPNKDTIKDYETELKDRYLQKDRYFLFLKKCDKIVGLANLYFHNGSLFVAEYYIIPDKRRQKSGYESFVNIIKWAKGKAKDIQIEVDKDLKKANKFWQSFNSTLDDSGPRNIFTITLE